MRKLKRIVAGLLVSTMLLSVVGCGFKSTSTGNIQGSGEKMTTVEVSGKPIYEYTEGNAIKQIKERGKLIVGIDSGYVPFCFTDPADGKSYGVNVAVAERLAEALGVKLEVVSEGFATVLSDLAVDSIDLCAAMVVNTEERAQVMAFSESVRQGYDYILVRTENVSKFNSKDKLVGATLTANNGSVQLTHAQEINGATVVACESASDAILQVASGTADAAVTSDANGLMYEIGYGGELTLLKDVSWENKTASLAVNKGDDDLLDLINQIIVTEIRPNVESLITEYTQLGVDKLGVK